MVVQSAKDANQRKPADEIVELIETRAREAYARREVEYPIDHVLTYVTGGVEMDRIENPYAAEALKQWAMAKFGTELSEEDVRGQSVRRLRDQLIGLQEQFLRDGKLETEIDSLLQSTDNKPETISQAMKKRFGVSLPLEEVEAASVNGNGTGVRDLLVRRSKQMLRQELTDLEQYVLITIFDQSWKDHLYAMDMLKAGIGLVGFAERDPRVVYKKEGFRYFQEMMAGIRDKVTDLIFRARVVGQAQARSAYRETAAVHQDAGGYGVGENVAQTGDVVVSPEASSESNESAEAAKVKTIVREAPKVGRNDPCPCGSGKKYKKCHGADVD
jgi:preprotein translocase subunit SecA